MNRVSHNRDGLRVSRNKWFGMMVVTHIVFQAILSTILILSALCVVFGISIVRSSVDYMTSETGISVPGDVSNAGNYMVLLIIVALVVAIGINVNSWLGILSLSLSHLQPDFLIQSFFTCIWFLTLVISWKGIFFFLLLWNGVQAVLLLFIIRDIRRASNSRVGHSIA